MIPDFLQDRAALYVSGAMPAPEREQFDLVLEFHGELRDLVAGLAEVGVALTLAMLPPSLAKPPDELKARILGLVETHPQTRTPVSVVVASPDGRVQWVNPHFTEMCGYSLEELRGRKLGPILQGEKTDRSAADRMRHAVLDLQPCHEEILNYHKNGTPYWVEIAITPILDDAGQPLWLIARESEISDRAAA